MLREPRFIQLPAGAAPALAQEALAGLQQPQAHIAPKFFYDALGSRLFDAITELDEYYPTRTEAAILATHRQAIAQAVQRLPGGASTLVDLGAGNCAKAASLFDSLQPTRYLALDISVDFLREALQGLQRRHPTMDLTGVGLDFSTQLALPEGLLQCPALVFYPGSSIGNFSPPQALRLLRQAFALAGGGGLLIGVDLDKPEAVLQAAYDDALGVTAAFNLNVLRHLNRLAGTDFVLADWRHRALWNAPLARVEMHLEARRRLAVRWPGGARDFDAGQTIHTENSYKWQPEAFQALLHEAGFGRVQMWTDERRWFALMLAASD